MTIRNYAFGPDPAGEAELARIKLESAGIPCFLAGREFASTCHSEEVEYERFSRRSFYLSLFLPGFPLLWGRGRHRCERCGYTWKRPSPPEEGTDRDADRSPGGEGSRS